MEFGDIRLDNRGKRLIESICDCQRVCIRQFSEGRNEEVSNGRFLRNQKVAPEKMLPYAYNKAAELCAGKHVLLVQDTSTMNFGLAPTAGYMAPVGNGAEAGRGFYVHPVIALDAEQGNCLGLAHATFFERKEHPADSPMQDADERKRQRNRMALEEKESHRWLDAALRAGQVCGQAAQLTVVADQEADIYEVLARLGRAGVGFLVRTGYDRSLRDGDFDNLRPYLESLPISHSFELALPATDKRSPHTAALDVKCGATRLKRTDIGDYKGLPQSLAVTVVEVLERPQTVVGNEKPICWRLLTSIGPQSVEDILQIIRWYCWRWVIEQLFRTIKRQGLDIASAEVETVHGLKNLTAVALMAAVRVMQLVQARQGGSELRDTEVFDGREADLLEKLSPKLEGRTPSQKNPHPGHSLAFAAWVIARLGGWKGYSSSERPPGPITMSRGLRRFQDMVMVAGLSP